MRRKYIILEYITDRFLGTCCAKSDDEAIELAMLDPGISSLDFCVVKLVSCSDCNLRCSQNCNPNPGIRAWNRKEEL